MAPTDINAGSRRHPFCVGVDPRASTPAGGGRDAGIIGPPNPFSKNSCDGILPGPLSVARQAKELRHFPKWRNVQSGRIGNEKRQRFADTSGHDVPHLFWNLSAAGLTSRRVSTTHQRWHLVTRRFFEILRAGGPRNQSRFWLGPFRENLGTLFAQSLTPGPSSGVPTNSMPAASKVVFKESTVRALALGTPTARSKRSTVLRVTFARSAVSSADQPNTARAALI